MAMRNKVFSKIVVNPIIVSVAIKDASVISNCSRLASNNRFVILSLYLSLEGKNRNQISLSVLSVHEDNSQCDDHWCALALFN